MKKLLSLFMAIVLTATLNFYTSISISAAQTPAFVVSNAVATTGETRNITISLVNNPGIASINIDVSFPSDLTLNSVTYNNAGLGGISQQPQRDLSGNLVSPVTLNWFNGLANTEGDMVFATLYFTVSDEATEGDKTISISYDPDNVYDINEENLDFAVTNGKITVVSCLHENTTVRNAKDATCTAKGYTGDTYCKNCDAKLSSGSDIAPLGHDYVPVVTNPTCTEGGYTTYTCSRCKDSYTGNNTNPTGHNYIAVVTNPTCTEQGYTTFTCSYCGDIYITDYTAIIEHTPSDWITDTESQIGVTGSKHKECTVCGEVLKTGIVPPKLQNPIVSIYVSGYYTVKSNQRFSSGNDNYGYELHNFSPEFTVRYLDQSEEKFRGSGFWKEDYYYDLEITCDVPCEEWEIGVPYTCTATLLEFSDTFSITLAEIDSVYVPSKECIKNMTGYRSGFWDELNQTWVENAWFYYSTEPDEITVTMKDGTIFNGTYWEIVERLGIWASISSDQSYKNQWDIGEHKAYLSIGDYQTEYTVNIIAGPIAKIEIADMEITEYTHGYYSDNGNYIYNELSHAFTAVMNDGSIKEFSDGWVVIDGMYYSLSLDTSNQYNQQWSAGNTYEVTASILGAICTFNVTIKESPIASIQMDDVEIIEYTQGEWKGDQYIYNWFEPSGKAIMKDGSERIINFGGSYSYDSDGKLYCGFEVDGENYSLFMDASSQYEQSWTAGNTYRVMCSALGMNDSLNITVTESPIASVAIDDLTLIQGIDSYDYGSFDYYYISPTYTVTFKDGTQKTTNNGDSIYLGGGLYSYLSIDVDQWQSPLEAGNTYELTGRIGPAVDTFTLTVAENPVDWIEVLRNPDKTEYYDFEYLNLKGLALRVHYKDGDYEDFTVESPVSTVMEYSFFSEKYQRADNIWSYETFPAGQTTVSYRLFGKEFEIPVTVQENPVFALSVKEGENKSLLLTVVKNDRTIEEWKILGIPYFYHSDDGFIVANSVVTDHGCFEINLRQNENGYVFALQISQDEVIESNVLANSEWLEVAALLPTSLGDKSFSWLSDAKKEHFLGNLTAENIDDTIRFIFERDENVWEHENAIATGEYIDDNGYEQIYFIYEGDFVKQELIKYLALDEIDLSISDRYDPETGTYQLITGFGGGEYFPNKLEYCNGVWTAEYHNYFFDKPLSVYYLLNDDHKIIRISDKAYRPGDINSDEKVNNKDLTRLFQYLSKWDVEVNEAALDINGDGKVNNKDLTRLFQYLSKWDVEIF